MGDSFRALEVDDTAGPIFGHGHAVEADDVLAGAVDRGGGQDHGVRRGGKDGERERQQQDSGQGAPAHEGSRPVDGTVKPPRGKGQDVLLLTAPGVLL